MRQYLLALSLVSFAHSSQADPCSVLCKMDGSTICSGGSWSKNGICHAYFLRGDPSLFDHCYHTSRTKESCPSSGTPVKVADAQRIIERLQAARGGNAGVQTTTSRVPLTSSTSTSPTSTSTTIFRSSTSTTTRSVSKYTNTGMTANTGESVEARVVALRRALPCTDARLGAYLEAPADNAFLMSYQSILATVNFDALRFPESHLFAKLPNEEMYGPAAKREFVRSVFSQIFNPVSGFFLSNDEVPQYMRINPAGRQQPNYQNIYRAIGRYLSLAITLNQAVGVSLPVYFFSYILGKGQLDLDDIRQDEPMLAQTLGYLLTCPASELEFMPLMVGAGETVVATDATRQYVVNQKLNSLIGSHELMTFISQGFREVIPLDILQRFLSPIDLKNLILGTPELDVEDLIRNITWGIYEGISVFNPEFRPRVERVLRTLSQEQLGEFLRFATNLRTVPFGGFGQLNPNISIFSERPGMSLPRVYQCYNWVFIPVYSSDSVLRGKLLMALYGSNWGLK